MVELVSIVKGSRSGKGAFKTRYSSAESLARSQYAAEDLDRLANRDNMTMSDKPITIESQKSYIAF